MFAFQLIVLLLITRIQESHQEDNGFKWYEGDKFIDPDGNYTALVEEYVFRQLNESGVCRDQMTVNKEGTYMGMDLFMPLMGQYFDEMNRIRMTSPDLTILTIHHLNTMVSYTYSDNRSPRPLFMGTFKKTAYGKPRDGQEPPKRVVDPFTQRLNEICPLKEGKKYSQFITGYSIDTGDEYRKSVLVCEEKIVTVPFLPNITSKSHWNSQKKVEKDRIDECTTNSGLIYCDRGEEGRGKEKLMSIMALPKKQNDPEPYLIGYYSEEGGREVSTTSREYRIVAYDSEGINPSNGPDGIKIDGHLAEIDVYRATDQGVEGMYFTIDGDACYFFKKYDELFEGGQLTKIPDFENPAERKFNKRNCHSYLTYIGCPMGFCYENNFDASFTIKEKVNGIDKTFIYFTKTMMYWKLEDSKLPLDIPRVQDAMKPVRKAKIQRGPWWQQLLEGFLNFLEDLARELLGLAYSSFPCKDYFVNQESAVCMTRSVGAAFAVPLKDSYKIFLYETVMHNWFISMARDTNPRNEMQGDPFSKKNRTPYDAAWYNSKESRVYLFSGKQYTSYKHDDGVNNWNDKQEGPLTAFGIDKNYLDAVVNKDGYGYFFHDNLFWNVSEENWKKSDKEAPGTLSLLEFFDVRGECFANKEEDFEHLISRYKEKNWTLAEGNKNAIEENKRSTSKEPKPRSRLFILWFVIGGLLIVIIAYSAMYLYGKRENKFVTKRKVEYIGSRTGRKTSPSKTSSRTSKKSNLSSIKTLSTPSSNVESKM